MCSQHKVERPPFFCFFFYRLLLYADFFFFAQSDRKKTKQKKKDQKAEEESSRFVFPSSSVSWLCSYIQYMLYRYIYTSTHKLCTILTLKAGILKVVDSLGFDQINRKCSG